MAISLFGPKCQFFDTRTGVSLPLNGGEVYLFEAGTVSTPKTSYTNSDGDVANAHPVVLDEEGRADIYLGTGFYKVVVKASDGTTVFTTDDYEGTTLILDAITSPSDTSVAIATGSKVFEVEANRAFPVGGFVIVTYDVDPTKYMHGQVTDYTGTTLTVNVGAIGSSGTFNDWTVSLSGPRGATGAAGATGGGTGDMLAANNLSELASKPAARATLGLGSSAVLDVGTTALKVLQLDADAKIPAVDGSLLTNLPSPTGLGISALGGFSGTKDSTTFARGDGTFAVPVGPTTGEAVGTYLIAKKTSSGSLLSNTTIAGSNINFVKWDATDVLSAASSPTGTWKNMCGRTLAQNESGLFLRTA